MDRPRMMPFPALLASPDFGEVVGRADRILCVRSNETEIRVALTIDSSAPHAYSHR
jgi:hypothetical protein